MEHVFSSFLLCVCCVTLMAQQYAANVDSLIRTAVSESKIPGAVVCIVENDHIAYMQAYGNRQVFPDTLPMTVLTQFDLASLSKCVGTGMAMMTLIERGLVALNDPITKYLPNYLPYEYADGTLDREQKIVDFLTHTSGMPAYASYTELLKDEPTASPARRKELLLMHMGNVKRQAPAGTNFCYSCLNFITLQYVIEKLTGLPLNEYVEKEVFRKLGMSNTCYYPIGSKPIKGMIVAPTEKISNAQGTIPSILLLNNDAKRWGNQNVCYEAIVHDPLAREVCAGVSGNASVFSTAEDLAKMAVWMFHPQKKGPFSAATLQLMLTVPEGYESFGRVLAWDQSSDYSGCKGHETSNSVACHTGYTGTSMVIDMEKKVAVILLTNRAHPDDKGGVGALRKAVADAVFSKF